MKFYDIPTQTEVLVDDREVRKQKLVRKTSIGEQVRYAFTAELAGNKYFKFVSEAEFHEFVGKEEGK